MPTDTNNLDHLCRGPWHGNRETIVFNWITVVPVSVPLHMQYLPDSDTKESLPESLSFLRYLWIQKRYIRIAAQVKCVLLHSGDMYITTQFGFMKETAQFPSLTLILRSDFFFFTSCMVFKCSSLDRCIGKRARLLFFYGMSNVAIFVLFHLW